MTMINSYYMACAKNEGGLSYIGDRQKGYYFASNNTRTGSVSNNTSLIRIDAVTANYIFLRFFN